jgi:hypothetical protein
MSIHLMGSKGTCLVHLIDKGGIRYIESNFGAERINLSTGSDNYWVFKEGPEAYPNGYRQWNPLSNKSYDLFALGGPTYRSPDPDKIGIIKIVKPNTHEIECTLTPVSTHETKLFSSTGVF